MRIGIVSDTHDLLREEVIEALDGCDVILHAGDVCDQRILDQLARIAPVHAARGNNDWSLAGSLHFINELELDGKKIMLVHIKSSVGDDTSGYDMFVYGHTHRYLEKRKGNTLFINPGSCGPRHVTQPITLAIAETDPNVPGADGIRITRVDIPHDRESLR